MKETITLKMAVKNRSRALEALIAKKQNDLQCVPEGKLRITHSMGRPRYYHCLSSTNKNGVYIPKDRMDLVRALAQKSYDENVVATAKREKSAAEKYLKALPDMQVEDVFENLPEVRQELVIPVRETDEMFLNRWITQPYPYVTNRREHPVIITDDGKILDSKSELAILSQFEKRKIPHLPQFPLSLNDWGVVYADFKVLNIRTRKEYYWEHLGMLDSADYRKRSLPKLNAYVLNGYIPGKNLILSWESEESRLDMRMIDRLIDEFLI